MISLLKKILICKLCYHEESIMKENDREIDMKVLMASAEQGYTKAQYNLGICYDFGKGVEQDKKEAFTWYKKAAQQGDAKAKIALMMLNKTKKGK